MCSALFGHGPFSVVFWFRPLGGGVSSVRSRCSSRAGLARLLRRFRLARLAVRSLPRSVVPGSVFPRFGLRWLACRPVLVVVVGPGLRPWFSVVPAARSASGFLPSFLRGFLPPSLRG